MERLTTIFGALADPIRLRILALIAHDRELCVCELVGALALPQPKVSRHCKLLNEAGLITSRREAQWVLHSLNEEMPDWIRQALEAAIDGVRLDPQYKTDRQRLCGVTRPAIKSDKMAV